MTPNTNQVTNPEDLTKKRVLWWKDNKGDYISMIANVGESVEDCFRRHYLDDCFITVIQKPHESPHETKIRLFESSFAAHLTTFADN